MHSVPCCFIILCPLLYCNHYLSFLLLTYCSFRLASFTSSSFSVMFCLLICCKKGSSWLTLDGIALMFVTWNQQTTLHSYEDEGTTILQNVGVPFDDVTSSNLGLIQVALCKIKCIHYGRMHNTFNIFHLLHIHTHIHIYILLRYSQLCHISSFILLPYQNH